MTFFRGQGISLSFEPLDTLLEASRAGLRLWELFRLEPGGDVLHYVDAHALDSSRRGHWNGTGDRDTAAAFRRWMDTHLVRADLAELANLLDQVFTEADRRWREVEIARAQVRELGDPLVRYELDLLDMHAHPNDKFRERHPRETHVLAHSRLRPVYVIPSEILEVLRTLLSHPAIGGITHRGRGDWNLIRMICEEQARRCGGPPKGDDNAFPCSILAPNLGVNIDPYVEPEDYFPELDPYPAWCKGIRFQFEGFRLYELFVEDKNVSSGWDHSVVDRRLHFHVDKVTRAPVLHRAKVVLAGYDDPERSSARTWLRHPAGWFAGVWNDCEAAGALLGLLTDRGFVPDGPDPSR